MYSLPTAGVCLTSSYGIYTPLETLKSLKQFSAERPDGSVAVVGIPHESVGLGYLTLALTS